MSTNQSWLEPISNRLIVISQTGEILVLIDEKGMANLPGREVNMSRLVLHIDAINILVKQLDTIPQYIA